MWLRVFSRSDSNPSPVRLSEHLHAAGLPVVPTFKGDDLGWTEGALALAAGTPLLLARFLTVEDDLRDDLNGYAAELEGYSFQPAATGLMERVIQTKQLITVRKPVDHADELTLDRLAEATVTWLAAETDGVWQADGRGWFAADGTPLVTEY
jgi:hypothetical protein